MCGSLYGQILHIRGRGERGRKGCFGGLFEIGVFGSFAFHGLIKLGGLRLNLCFFVIIYLFLVNL